MRARARTTSGPTRRTRSVVGEAVTIAGGASWGVVGASTVMSVYRFARLGAGSTIAAITTPAKSARRPRPWSAAAARPRARPSPDTAAPVGTNTIEVCMCGRSNKASLRRWKWNGLRPSSSTATPWEEPAPMITSVPSAITLVPWYPATVPADTGWTSSDVGLEVQRRLVAVPQRRAQSNREGPARPPSAEAGQGVRSEVAHPQRARLSDAWCRVSSTASQRSTSATRSASSPASGRWML